ncbi:MAG: hypothetical protein COW24_04905 [Candidatus Kerfeldbacteria bacterium CG15_BIG_FIL_POST_REV_8_21_14_020_45_12]|uniref:Uncharacterized protein n=1 Tax=Candidatus Kerfeldbacteria bacterium CG15_BIG_FIL_POST_REV_8_21_14_020_45_12 TaxID=2014247 RepID=A0A2M7H2R4_9BACT|nr:MAG: hypothetical protein COW24_04905 [Candidatus Kerfeldbacteria bacterium CG15_BIG_FIL_POST_REV_8_21_14_020_45_12]PJA93244.1 MAG: hypothetical protein CO132_04010 [Candidatus Kerfeldbacteria bacterium CG_4_9_14_3_um_filter_45_8]
MAADLKIEQASLPTLADYLAAITPEQIEAHLERTARFLEVNTEVLTNLVNLGLLPIEKIQDLGLSLITTIRSTIQREWVAWEAETSLPTGSRYILFMRDFFPEAARSLGIDWDELIKRERSDFQSWSELEPNYDEWVEGALAMRRLRPDLAADFTPTEAALEHFWHYAYSWIDDPFADDGHDPIIYFINNAATLRLFSEPMFQIKLRSMDEVKVKMQRLFDSPDRDLADDVKAAWGFKVITAQSAYIDEQGAIVILPEPAEAKASPPLPGRSPL